LEDAIQRTLDDGVSPNFSSLVDHGLMKLELVVEGQLYEQMRGEDRLRRIILLGVTKLPQ